MLSDFVGSATLVAVMMAVPALTPVILRSVPSIVATVGLLVDHVKRLSVASLLFAP